MSTIDGQLGFPPGGGRPSPEEAAGYQTGGYKPTKEEAMASELDNLGKDVLTKVQETYDLVKPEAEVITKGVLSSGKRLDAKPRVFSAVPNSILVYGGLAVILYLVFKK